MSLIWHKIYVNIFDKLNKLNANLGMTLYGPVNTEAANRNIKENFTTLCKLLALEGANSYYTEVPGIMADSVDYEAYPLAQRVEMNLIATDRILARHFLGI